MQSVGITVAEDEKAESRQDDNAQGLRRGVTVRDRMLRFLTKKLRKGQEQVRASTNIEARVTNNLRSKLRADPQFHNQATLIEKKWNLLGKFTKVTPPSHEVIRQLTRSSNQDMTIKSSDSLETELKDDMTSRNYSIKDLFRPSSQNMFMGAS